MGVKFKCMHCSNYVISGYLQPGDSLNCPFCKKEVIVPENLFETNEESNILRALKGEEIVSNAADDQLIMGENQKNANTTGRVVIKFKTLLAYGKTISVLGWLMVVIGIILAFAVFIEQNIWLVPSAIIVVIMGIAIVAYGQLISCFIAIENNTRATYEMMHKQAN